MKFIIKLFRYEPIFICNETMSIESNKMQLPRLLCISNVPIESSCHGSVVLYRLLQKYPPEKLQVIEYEKQKSILNRRLLGVRYHTISLGRSDFFPTRFTKLHSFFILCNAAKQYRKINKIHGSFSPEAVLTVAHGYLWITAAEYAKRSNIPLHIINHDDTPEISSVPTFFRKHLQQQFGHIYRQAASQLCVSPFMREEYFNRYGVKGKVLYPSLGSNTLVFTKPPDNIKEHKKRIIFAFAGSVHGPYAQALRKLADLLEPHNGQVFIYGPLTEAQAKSANLNCPNIQVKGLLPSTNDLIINLRDKVDVLFVPMSFEGKDRPNMEISFPSKLAVYTATGLPLLIYGPPYCSAVRWARENPGVAEVVETEDNNTFASAIHRITQDEEYRMQLAQSSINACLRYFSHESAWEVLTSCLMRAQ
ncbi:MAG: hypothetical protein OEV42_20155 [Deltaproteobacteria bacterium]|nr:hypothetical protein [Deltaproteobacteria bacterium]